MVDQFGEPMRHTFFLIAASIALYAASAAIFTARRGSSSPVQQEGGAEIGNSSELEQSPLRRQMRPDVSAADLAAVINGNTCFGLQALQRLAMQDAGNLVFSPYGITVALALAAAGAQGATRTGIARALSFALPEERLNPALNELNLRLHANGSGAAPARHAQAPELNVANAMWLQRGFPLLPAFLDTIALNFGAGVCRADFMHDTAGASRAINDWAAQQTAGRLPAIVAPGTITHDARLVLSNAIWFKAGWESPFDTGATNDQSFFNHDGTVSSVPFMCQRLAVPFYRDGLVQAVDLPYAGSSLSMLILMPETGTLDAYLESLAPDTLNALVRQLAPHGEVALALPKFSFDHMPDMVTILQAMGMNEAFEAGNADFSGISGKQELVIASVLHQARIGIDEQGTEADAPLRMVRNKVSPAAAAALTLTIDRPFLFIIRDRGTGAVLFMGKIRHLGRQSNNNIVNKR